MSKSVKPLGHVEQFSTGFAARVYRYGNGRKLPFHRILLQANGLPFQSRLEALNALAAWKDNPRACKQIRVNRLV